jgi:hypothetical protein
MLLTCITLNPKICKCLIFVFIPPFNCWYKLGNHLLHISLFSLIFNFRFVVIVSHENHFCFNSRQLKGGMKTKMRHLQILGFKVIHVSNILGGHFGRQSDLLDIIHQENHWSHLTPQRNLNNVCYLRVLLWILKFVNVSFSFSYYNGKCLKTFS